MISYFDFFPFRGIRSGRKGRKKEDVKVVLYWE